MANPLQTSTQRLCGIPLLVDEESVPAYLHNQRDIPLRWATVEDNGVYYDGVALCSDEDAHAIGANLRRAEGHESRWRYIIDVQTAGPVLLVPVDPDVDYDLSILDAVSFYTPQDGDRIYIRLAPPLSTSSSNAGAGRLLAHCPLARPRGHLLPIELGRGAARLPVENPYPPPADSLPNTLLLRDVATVTVPVPIGSGDSSVGTSGAISLPGLYDFTLAYPFEYTLLARPSAVHCLDVNGTVFPNINLLCFTARAEILGKGTPYGVNIDGHRAMGGGGLVENTPPSRHFAVIVTKLLDGIFHPAITQVQVTIDLLCVKTGAHPFVGV